LGIGAADSSATTCHRFYLQILFRRERERERAKSVEGKQQTPLYSLIKKYLGEGDKGHI
jgi:hypothetical protein